MRFLVDAQLPVKLASWLSSCGHNAVHVSDLAQGYRAPDSDIADIAVRENRIVISKDEDFRVSHLLIGSPRWLPFVKTGNIRNQELVALCKGRLGEIAMLFEQSRFLEIRRGLLIAHTKS